MASQRLALQMRRRESPTQDWKPGIDADWYLTVKAHQLMAGPTHSEAAP